MYKTGEQPEIGDTVAIVNNVPNHTHHRAHVIGQVTALEGNSVSVTVWTPNQHTANVKADNLNLIKRAA